MMAEPFNNTNKCKVDMGEAYRGKKNFINKIFLCIRLELKTLLTR